MNEVLSRVIQKLSRSAFYPNDFKAAFGDATITSERIALALEQFMNTMISGNSKFDQYLLGQTQLTPSELRGLELFNGEVNPGSAQKGADCFHCHGTSLFTNNQFINNGLDSVLTDLGRGAVTGISFDNGKFKVPSLRNIAQTAPYMHDGRFATLDDVLEFYNTGVIHDSPNIDPNMHGFEGGLGLTSAELADLKAFLLTLTDQEFLNKEEFKSPF
jgi:cytochrome c peroxidase